MQIGVIMKVQEIRESFISFFKKNDHIKIESSSLIPHNDKTLLFANAGMNQFKEYFTGNETPSSKRATTIQKCVRAGGKHNDLENVGLTARHHTFFEMLGNFSFGDYFKVDAIKMAWSFLTEELKIPKDKLYITVHYSDQEAFDIWEKVVGIPKDRIFKKGDKDNFWEMGEFGPCGPCSEIFYDHGEQHEDKSLVMQKDGDILDDELRYVEIWNLVFMQYEKTIDGRRNLPNPSIDTGMGLERIAAVLQNKYWNYDTDAFTPIISKIESLSGKKYVDPKYQSSIRIISDHIRSATMLITDGITPSNEGRGYVLRRIIRRAVKHVQNLECAGTFLRDLVPVVLETLGKEYPQNKSNQLLAEKFLELEEKKFLETLEIGIKYLNQALETECDNKTLKGSAAFKLYDTYGFPLDLTEIIVKEKGFTVDQKGFEDSMNKRKEESKKSWKGGINDDKSAFFSTLESFGTTEFNNTREKVESKLLDIIELEDCDALIFDKTPFYGEGGGQVGDTGFIFTDNEHILITDTQKPVDGLHAHIVEKGHKLQKNSIYHLQIDINKRKLTERNHSATHLLQSALIEVLGDHVKQSGSMVNSERLRFDFTHMQALTAEEIMKVESLVNMQIQNSINVSSDIMNIKEAQEKGAMALFGEKYGSEVRVLQMGEFSIELCGGTHVKNTSDINLFVISSESSLSTGVRRIEAMTSLVAFTYLKERDQTLKEIELLVNSKDTAVISRVKNSLQEIKNLQKDIKQLEQKVIQANSNDLFSNQVKINDEKSLCIVELDEGADLKSLSDLYIDKNPEGIVLMIMPKKDKLSILLRANKKSSIPCNKILGDSLKVIDGRGGGKPDMAQGSGDPKNLSAFKEHVISTIKSTIS